MLLLSLRNIAIVTHVELESVSITRSNNSDATLQHTKHFFRLSGAVSDTKNLLVTPVYMISINVTIRMLYSDLEGYRVGLKLS